MSELSPYDERTIRIARAHLEMELAPPCAGVDCAAPGWVSLAAEECGRLMGRDRIVGEVIAVCSHHQILAFLGPDAPLTELQPWQLADLGPAQMRPLRVRRVDGMGEAT